MKTIEINPIIAELTEKFRKQNIASWQKIREEIDEYLEILCRQEAVEELEKLKANKEAEKIFSCMNKKDLKKEG
jgi:hypothetical protein